MMPVMPAADAARAVIGPDDAAARAVMIRIVAAVESRPKEMPSVKAAMPDEAVGPADKTAAEATAMKTAAESAAAMEAAATMEASAAMKSATAMSAATMAAARLDQLIGQLL